MRRVTRALRLGFSGKKARNSSRDLEYESPAETCVEGFGRTRRNSDKKVRPPDRGNPSVTYQVSRLWLSRHTRSPPFGQDSPRFAGDQPRVSRGLLVRRTTLRTTRSRPGVSRVSRADTLNYTFRDTPFN
jgi:hypothetical protein